MAFDRHMNIVLADTEEFRLCKKKTGGPRQEVKRVLGLTMLRGESVVSLIAEAPVPRADAVRGPGGDVGGPGAGTRVF